MGWNALMNILAGLTGGYCAGKNEAASRLEKLGFRVIDVDLLGHKALAASLPRLAEVFGRSIIAPDGSIDRRALGSIVFSDPEKLRLHESIVHPEMLRLLDSELEKGGLTCINAALLYRFPQASRCDIILEVRAPLLKRLRRAWTRDGVGARDAMRRIASQHYLWKLRPTDGPPILPVKNAGTLADLDRELLKALPPEIRDRLGAE